MVRVIFDGQTRAVRPKTGRVWRLLLVPSSVLEHGRASPILMQVLVGHSVNIFQILRDGLVVLFEGCQFMQKGIVQTERRLYDTQRWEWEQCWDNWTTSQKSRFDAVATSVTHCSDSSTKEYALHVITVTNEELFHTVLYQKRWRLKCEMYPETMSHGFQSLGLSNTKLRNWTYLSDRNLISTRTKSRAHRTFWRNDRHPCPRCVLADLLLDSKRLSRANYGDW